MVSQLRIDNSGRHQLQIKHRRVLLDICQWLNSLVRVQALGVKGTSGWKSRICVHSDNQSQETSGIHRGETKSLLGFRKWFIHLIIVIWSQFDQWFVCISADMTQREFGETWPNIIQVWGSHNEFIHQIWTQCNQWFVCKFLNPC